MHIVPYVITDGVPSIKDSVLKTIYLDMVRKHLIEKVFRGGKIKNEHDFLFFVKSPANVFHTVWSDEGNILMIAWLNNFGANFAFAHFCCWPETWGKTSIELGKQTLNYWFDFMVDEKTPVLDVILGMTPNDNRLALRYIKRLGLTALGVLPKLKMGDSRSGAVISYIERDEVTNGI